MTTASDIQVTSFDDDEIKQSLITFLQSTGEFGDFDYDGSAINTMVDLLTRNTTYMAFLGNMLANESFINTAKLRSNVVAHAQTLSYSVRSETASTLICDIIVTPVSVVDIPSTISIPINSSFLSNVGGKTYTFVNRQDVIMSYDSVNEWYSASDVTLTQGQLITNTFTHTAGTKITINNSSADTATFLVTVAPSDAVDDKTAYIKATSILELTQSSTVYFLGEDKNGEYFIEFGQNVIGSEPVTNSIVEITYINTEDHANGIDSLVAGSSILGYSDIAVTVTSPSNGGSVKEDVDDIRFLAPKSYQAQGRALTPSDYIPLIKENFSYVDSVSAWGGETNNPPAYGSVMISLIPTSTNLITESGKNDIISFLNDYNVGSITPVIVDPDIFYLELAVTFDYNEVITNDTFDTLSTKVIALVEAYDDDFIGNFLGVYNESVLIDGIMGISGITTAGIDKTVYKIVPVLRFNDPSYEINFNNEIAPGSVLMENFNVYAPSSVETLTDDSAGNVVHNYTIDEVTTSENVGTIDYTTGEVVFTINMIQTLSEVKFYVTPVDRNFHIEAQSVISIAAVTTQLPTRRITT